MNNTEKKLDALIDALGFDVEEIVTTVHPPFSIMKACFTDRYNQQGPVHTVNYKLTKRKDERPLIKAHSIGSFGLGNQ
jgi:hypothetical protein